MIIFGFNFLFVEVFDFSSFGVFDEVMKGVDGVVYMVVDVLFILNENIINEVV